METLWLTPPALIFLIYLISGVGIVPAAVDSLAHPLLPWLLLSGAVTAAPLLFFAMAARRLRLSTLGFFQYLSPSVQLLLAVLLFGEAFGGFHALSFGLIWFALLIYSIDNRLQARSLKRAAINP